MDSESLSSAERIQVFPLQSARLLALIAEIEGRLKTVEAAAPEAGAPLHAAWSRLIELFSIPEPPQLRDCPVCGRSVMRAATLCGWCWSKLDGGKELVVVAKGAVAWPQS